MFSVLYMYMGLLVGIAMASPRAADSDLNEMRAAPGTTHDIIGITAPARTVTLGTVRPARIAEILVPEGSAARQGQQLVRLDSRVQLAQVEIAKADAESTLSVELARARWELAKRELARLSQLHGRNNASSKELTDALSQAEIAQLEFEIAQAKREQDRRGYERQKAILQEYDILAPFSGYVSHQVKHAGETVDQLEGILTLSQLDPLHIAVQCPLELASSIHEGDRLTVRPADVDWSARIGTVVLTQRVADGASQTFKVKVAVDNSDGGWMAGAKVVVEFPSTAESHASNSGGVSRIQNEGVDMAEQDKAATAGDR